MRFYAVPDWNQNHIRTTKNCSALWNWNRWNRKNRKKLELEPLELQKTAGIGLAGTAKNRMEPQTFLCEYLWVLAVPVRFLRFWNLIEPLELKVLTKTAGIVKKAGIGTPEITGIVTAKTAGIRTTGTAIEKSWNRPCLSSNQHQNPAKLRFLAYFLFPYLKNTGS